MQQGRYIRGVAPATLTIRHHPVLLLARTWQPGLLLLFAAVLVVVLAGAPGGGDFAWIWFVALGGIFLIGACWIAIAYLRWSHDRLILTPTRLIEIAGMVGWHEEHRELRLDQLQSVEIDIRNPIMRWCGCADVIISITAIGPLRFAAAQEPFMVRDRILARLHDHARQQHEQDEATIRASVAELLEPEKTPLLPELARPARRPRKRRRWPASRPLAFGRQINGIVWRRHPWFLCKDWLAPTCLLMLAAALPFLVDHLSLFGLLERYGAGITFCLVVAACVWLWWRWVNWRNDYYVVTPDRLLEVNQLPLGLRQQFTEAALDKVQDIRYTIPNPLASLLNYGNVIVRTASADQPFTFEGIARPRQLAAQIDRHVTALRLADAQGRHQAIRGEFSRWLTTYDQLRNGPVETLADERQRTQTM